MYYDDGAMDAFDAALKRAAEPHKPSPADTSTQPLAEDSDDDGYGDDDFDNANDDDEDDGYGDDVFDKDEQSASQKEGGGGDGDEYDDGFDDDDADGGGNDGSYGNDDFDLDDDDDEVSFFPR